MALRPRLLVLTTVGLAVTVLAVFGSGTLGLKPVAGSPEQGPEPRVLAAALTLQPSTAIPNQAITVSGTGFTLPSIPGGAGPNGVHQITGLGSSFVVVAGILLGPPHVTYPLNLDSAGSLTARVSILVTLATLSAGSQTVTVTDEQGVTASATLTIPARTLTLGPTTSNRGSTVTATGAGFPISNPDTTGSFPVSLDYAGTALGIVTPDGAGAFTTTFEVPVTALIPSTNTVTAMVLDKPASSTASHSIPAAYLEPIPAIGSPGATITVAGRNFAPIAPVTSLTVSPAQVVPLPAPSTNAVGSFDISILVPSIPTGNATISVRAGGITAIVLFTVLDSGPAPVPTRTPTPTPVPLVPPAVALEPLLVSDNLLRVWNFDNATKVWTFFDPRPAFAAANTITEMRTGQIFWINVVFEGAVILNGRTRALNSGWNLVSW